MKLVVVSCVFPPEPVVSAQTSAEIADKLVQAGHTVIVLAPYPNRPQGRIFPGYSRRLFSREITPEGYSILRLFSTFSPRSTMFSRWLENVTFGLSTALALCLLPKPDLIYANTWPIFAQGIICLVAFFRKIPLVLSIQDIYPEALLAQGRISEKHIFFRILRWLDRKVVGTTNALIVISKHFAELYIHDRQVPPARIHIIPNWIDPHSIQSVPPAQFRKRYGIPFDAFVFGYGGNIGVAAKLESILRAFTQLEQDRVFLLIAGDGNCRASCESLARQLGLHNVIFHHPWLSIETSEVLASADVLLLPTQGDQSLVSVPSKMLTYLLAARPILAIARPESETAHIIANARAGWVVAPDDLAALGQKLKEIRLLSATSLMEMGLLGRAYAMQHFTSEVSLPKVIKILEHVAQGDK